MPVFPDSTTNFLRGMSDFWTRFFRDSPVLSAAYDALQLQIGQVYLDLLTDVLGLSLDDTPLFSKKYFHYFPVREDQVRYVEGPAREDDRWVYTPAEYVAGVPQLLNRVFLPTATYEAGRDYDVINGALHFRVDPFPAGGATPPGFPMRQSQYVFPYAFNDPFITDWLTLGVSRGDILRFTLGNGTVVDAPIYLVEPTRLVVGNGSTALKEELRELTYEVEVLRVPFDASQKRHLLANTPHLLATEEVDGDLIDGTWFYRSAGAVDFTETDVYGRQRFLGKYLSISDSAYPENNGVFRISAIIDSTTVELARSSPFSRPTHPFLIRTAVLDYEYAITDGPAVPISRLPHAHLVSGSVVVHARRAEKVFKDDTLYPPDGEVLEGVDYTVDYALGEITHLSAWQYNAEARVDYAYYLQITYFARDAAATWVPGLGYNAGTFVKKDGVYYYARTSHLSGMVFEPSQWLLRAAPIEVSPTAFSRQVPFWGADVLLDEQALYTRYGYLLMGGERPSSEAYRAFLRTVLHLFTHGPVLQRIEAALNALAGFANVRDDGEQLLRFDSGVLESGSAGTAYGRCDGRGGTIGVDGQLTLPVSQAMFFTTDVPTRITLRRTADPFNEGAYVVQEVLADNIVKILPLPSSSEVDGGFQWSFDHLVSRNRFTCERNFTEDDVGGYLVIDDPRNEMNRGAFRVLSILDVHTVELDAPGGLHDEQGVSWRFSRTNEQLVVTNRHVYTFPLRVPLRADLQRLDALGALTFQSFEPLTTAFHVVDYLVDPTWWYNQTIPREIFEGADDSPARRRAFTAMIPNVIGALDQAAIGDPGVVIGRDDEGTPPLRREVAAFWRGDNIIHLQEPVASGADVGQYLEISSVPSPAWAPNTYYEEGQAVRHLGSEHFALVAHTSGATFTAMWWKGYCRPAIQGCYKILAVNDDMRLTLERFPPSGAVSSGNDPILSKDCTLPPRLYRRSVGFVLFDRFLKYHSLRVRIDLSAYELNSDFVRDLVAIMDETRPAHVFLYIDPALQWREPVTVSEDLSLDIGVHHTDRMMVLDSILRIGGPAHLADCYAYVQDNTAGVFTSAPETFTITPTPPAWLIGSYRTVFVFGRFTTGTRSDGRPLCEVKDYNFDRATGEVTVFDPALAAYRFDWLCVFLHNTLLPLREEGDNMIVIGGSDPTRDLPVAANRLVDVGLLDRAISITITPFP